MHSFAVVHFTFSEQQLCRRAQLIFLFFCLFAVLFFFLTPVTVEAFIAYYDWLINISCQQSQYVGEEMLYRPPFISLSVHSERRLVSEDTNRLQRACNSGCVGSYYGMTLHQLLTATKIELKKEKRDKKLKLLLNGEGGSCLNVPFCFSPRSPDTQLFNTLKIILLQHMMLLLVLIR